MSDVHRSSRRMRWYIGCVQTHGGMNALYEKRLGHRRHADDLGGVGHACRVLLGSEQYDFIIRCTMCLLAFKCLLPIVEAGCHSMNAQIGIRDELRSCPLSGFLAVMRFNMTVHCGC